MAARENIGAKRAWSLKERAIRELKSFAAIFLYLWIVLGIFFLHEMIVLEEHHIAVAHYGIALMNALVLGKVMLVAENMRFAGQLADEPLFLAVLYRSIAFTILFIGFYMLEEIAVGVIKGKTLAQSFPDIGGGSVQGIFVVGIIMFVALTPFFAYRELGRVIGESTLHDLMFKRRSPR